MEVIVRNAVAVGLDFGADATLFLSAKPWGIGVNILGVALSALGGAGTLVSVLFCIWACPGDDGS
jgi:hypothetical protein